LMAVWQLILTERFGHIDRSARLLYMVTERFGQYASRRSE
jgi:hypothetical protein